MDDSSSCVSAIFLAHLEPDGRSQTLRDHLFGVSKEARRISGKVGLGAAGAAIGLLHDVGKYSGDFQEYLRRMALDQDTEQPEVGRARIDHSTAGAQTIWQVLKQKGKLEGIAGEILSVCVASHHSGLIDCVAPDGADKLSRRMLKPDPETHYAEAWLNADRAVTEQKVKDLNHPDLPASVCEFISRLCRTDRSETILRFKVGLLVRLLFSCLIDADRTDTADFSKPAAAELRQHGGYVEWTVLVRLLDRELKNFSKQSEVEQLRNRVSESCLSASVRPKGTFALTVPTGGGKTLASLRFALSHAAKWQMERVIYVSPYTSIIDQNAAVVRSILEPSGTEFGTVVLEHHSNLTPLKQTWRSKILSENWDAPVVFTTAVQVLEALFGSGTRAVRRMHQMANAILIFDEIQTLPVRCVHLFNNAMNFLVQQCGSSIVLCTATQPLLHRVDPAKGAINLPDGAEIMQDVTGLFHKFRRYEAWDQRKAGAWEHAEVAQLAVSETRRSGSCLVVVNTKNEALSIFNACRTAASEIALYHLSTGMCPAHRLEILAEVKARLDFFPVICVSTQLIEAGVDIDFGSVIRALAGLDSIAQAAGRCNRHGKRGIGRVHVVNLAGELPQALRDIRAAQEAAQRVLDENTGTSGDRLIDLGNPKLIEDYFHYYFFDRRQEMDYPVNADQAEREDTLLNMLAENRLAVDACAVPPPVYLRQSFMTAADAFQSIDASTRGIVVPFGVEGKAIIAELCSAHELGKQFTLLKRAQRFTVDVFPHVLERLQKLRGVYEAQSGAGILCLHETYYSSQFGLNVEGTEDMEIVNA
jgi:CRISPR-associated endonuclease/helicase Cas3